MAMRRAYRLSKEHRALLDQIGAVAVYRMIIEGQKAPVKYSWHMLNRMMRTGEAHKFEIDLVEALKVHSDV